MYSSGVGKTRIGFAEAGPPRPLPSASWDRVSGYVVSLAENPPIAPRAARECVSVPVNRNHDKVLERDILQAEKTYSEDQLQEVSFELRDVSPEFPDVLYAFIGAPINLSKLDIETRLGAAGILEKDRSKVFELLLWFGFLGILDRDGDEKFSYQYQYGVDRMLKEASLRQGFVIHPAFRLALGCEQGF